MGTGKDSDGDRIGRRNVLKAVGGGIGANALATDGFSWWNADGAVGEVMATPDAETGAFSLEGFTVRWSGTDGQLVVEHREHDDPLWQTNPGEQFVSAARVDLTVEEARGTFEITETVQTEYTDQTVTDVGVVDDAVVVRGELSGTDATTGYELGFERVGDGDLRFDVSVDSSDVDRVGVHYAADEDDHFFGFGEQYSMLDLNGETVPVISQEQGIGRTHPVISSVVETFADGASGGPLTTYCAMPYYLSTGGHSLALENTAYSVFDLEPDDRTDVRVFDSVMRGRLFAGTDPLDRIERFTEYAGRMDPLPDWIHDGAVVGMQGGTEKVRDIWSELQDRDTPISSFWLQDWVGQRDTLIGKQLWWNWELDETQYPNWDQLRSDLAAEDVSVMGYINPYLADPSEKDGSVDRSLYREARENGYFVETEDGEVYTVTITDFPSGILDLSNPDAREWIKSVIQDELLGSGLRGWMADFGEALPYDAELAAADPETYHNQYPVEWAKVNREAVADAGRDDAVFFTRSGFTRSPAHTTLFWEGDQMVTWDDHDGFETAIMGLLSGGISGLSLNHSDAGGYTSIEKWGLGYGREERLLKRWTEANAFTTLLRTHEGNQPEENVQFYSSADTYDHFARFAKVFAALKFYREELMQEASERGWPVVRHPFLHYPDDEEVYAITDQFMLGSELMVAPVVDKFTWSREVYLPDDEWTHVWSGETVDATGGQTVDADIPMGEPPVYYRADSDVGTQFVENLRSYDVH